MGGILRKLALSVGARKALAWIRSAQAGNEGPTAHAVVTWCLAHAAVLGLVFGCIVAGLGIYFGPDSQVVGFATGYLAPQLIALGLIPSAWQSTPGSLSAYNWYQFARNNNVEISALMAGWYAYNSGTCVVAGGLALGPLLIPCGLSAFLYASVLGILTFLGIVGSAKLAPAPEAPIPTKVKA